jgi:hypothetical protein
MVATDEAGDTGIERGVFLATLLFPRIHYFEEVTQSEVAGGRCAPVCLPLL